MPKCIFFTICDNECEGPERNYCKTCYEHWNLCLVKKEERDTCAICLKDEIELYEHKGICQHGFCLSCITSMINKRSLWYDDIRWMATTMIKKKMLPTEGIPDEEAIDKLADLIKFASRGSNMIVTSAMPSPKCPLCAKDIFVVPRVTKFSANYMNVLQPGIEIVNRTANILKSMYPGRELSTGLPKEQ
jgi:hypothetical protein